MIKNWFKFNESELNQNSIDKIDDILIDNSDFEDIEYSINDMGDFYTILISSINCYKLYKEIQNKVLDDSFEVLSSSFFNKDDEMEEISEVCDFMLLKIKPI